MDFKCPIKPWQTTSTGQPPSIGHRVSALIFLKDLDIHSWCKHLSDLQNVHGTRKVFKQVLLSIKYSRENVQFQGLTRQNTSKYAEILETCIISRTEFCRMKSEKKRFLCCVVFYTTYSSHEYRTHELTSRARFRLLFKMRGWETKLILRDSISLSRVLFTRILQRTFFLVLTTITFSADGAQGDFCFLQNLWVYYF